MNVIAILQARVSSSRLPKKVLLPLLDKPMLEHQIARVQNSKLIDELVIATSVEESDDALSELASKLGVLCVRGSLNDVLDRFYQAAKLSNAAHVVRLTGDCPLADSTVIDKVIQHHIDSGADYTSNVCPPTYPDGLDVEVFTFQSLECTWQSATLTSDREHVTSYIRKPESNFHIENVESSRDLSYLRWTVDEPEDFEFVSRIYEKLYPINAAFSTSDILMLLEKEPNLTSMNHRYNRNEGYSKSLLKDKE